MFKVEVLKSFQLCSLSLNGGGGGGGAESIQRPSVHPLGSGHTHTQTSLKVLETAFPEPQEGFQYTDSATKRPQFQTLLQKSLTHIHT